jgi:hypothetical protein
MGVVIPADHIHAVLEGGELKKIREEMKKSHAN